MTFYLGRGALGVLPVALVDIVAATFLLRVWRRSPGDPFAALPLAVFFAALGALHLVQIAMMSADELLVSWLFNHIGQSFFVLLTAPALVAFAYRFLGVTFPAESRFALRAVVAVCVFAFSLVVFSSFSLEPEQLFWEPAHERAHRTLYAGFDVGPLVPLLLLFGYLLALVVLLRKHRRLEGRRRTSALAFAFVIVLAVIGVVMQRLEFSTLGVVPKGTYTTYMLWVTLAALLLFATHTDEITRFHDRVAIVALVCVLATAAVLADQAVARVPTAGLSQHAAREAVDDVAVSAALVMIIATALVLLLIPRLAELAVLRPLRNLERAEADSRAKSVFLAAMSHELKTPLHAILHHARVLAERRDPEQQRSQTIASSAEHLLAMIEALLMAGRHDAGLAQPALLSEVTVAAVIDDVANVHRPGLLQRGMELSVDVDRALVVKTDKRILTQVLSNLVGNALKYGKRHVSVVATAHDDRLRIVVEDGGDGVPADVRDKIFQPFFQVGPSEGAGLGLAICRQLTEALQGTLTLEGKSAFVVDIAAPRVASAAPAAAAEAPVAFPALPAPLKATLLELAKNGDIAGLQAQAEQMKQDASTAAAASALDPLLQRFQLRAIRRLLGEDAPP